MKSLSGLIIAVFAVFLLFGIAAAAYSLTDTSKYDYKLSSKYIHSMEGDEFVVEMPIKIYKKGTDELLATENTLLIISSLGKINPENSQRVDLSSLPEKIYSYSYETEIYGTRYGEVSGGGYIFSEFGLNAKYKTVNDFASYLKTELQDSSEYTNPKIETIDKTVNGHRVIGEVEILDDSNWRAGGVAGDNHRSNSFTYYVIREDFYPDGSGLAFFKLKGNFAYDNNRHVNIESFGREPSPGSTERGITEMDKALSDAMSFADSVVEDAARAKHKLIVGNYNEVYGGYGAGSAFINTGAGDAGDVDYNLPLVIITGIFSAGAAVAGAAAAAGTGKSGNETERTSTYRMRIRKDFGDAIVAGDSPQTLYAQMIEVTYEGEEIEREDLTASMTMTSGGGLIVEDQTLTGGFLGAFISADEYEQAEEGVVKVAYTGKGGSFTNNIHFRIIGKPRIKFPEQGKSMDMRLNVLYGDGLTYSLEVELADFLELPKDVTITCSDEVPLSVSLEKTDDTHYTAKIVNNSPLPEKNATVKTYPVWVKAELEDDEIVEETFTVNFYPEGLSITDVSFDDEGRALFAAYDDKDTEEDDVSKTGFIVNLAVRTIENEKEVVKLLDGEDYTPEFGGFKGTDKRTEVLASKLEYEIEKRPDNTNKAYVFAPKKQIAEPEYNPYYLTLSVSCEYGGESYELSQEIRLIGDKLGVRKDRETELENLKRRIRKFGINAGVARFLRENADNLSADELRLLSKKIVYDSIVYYTQESADFMQTADSMDDWVTYLSIIKWVGDQAFSYLATVYTGAAGEAILTPAKEICVELIGEISSDLFMGYAVNWEEIKVGQHVSEMIENYVMSCFEDIQKTSPKKLAYVIAGLCIFNLIRHYTLDVDSDGKRSWYNAFASSFSDISLVFMKQKFGDFISNKAKDPSSKLFKLLNSSAVKMIEDMMPEGKLAVPGVNTLTEDVLAGPVFKKYLDEMFGFGASYVTNAAGAAAAEGLFVKVKVGTDDADRGVDWYVIVNPMKAVDKIVEYIFTSLYANFPFPTAEPGVKSEMRDPIYMNPDNNHKIG